MGGLVVYLTVFLSPTPWFNKSISLLYFEPYKAPQGYVPFNPCGSIIYHANYTPPTVPNGVDKARLERTWIGWLGTCTQDADGRRFCTTPSVGRPQWNMTFIQPNDTLYPARMPSRVKTKNILVSVIFSSIGFLAFAYIGLPYHIPSLRKRWAFSNTVVYSLRVAIVITGVVSLGTMANTQLSQTELDRFAAVDNFYQQAPCGTTREIKPGLLMQGKRGKAYQVLWVAWLMCYVAAAAGWAFRIHFPKADEPRPNADSDAELAAKADVEEFSKEKPHQQ
ncbi:hypothetical protein FRC03_000327 [Tulasnella sp. 419]|nr:hypothetical protein FRC03_000327 [Tulasnella sp. 419]